MSTSALEDLRKRVVDDPLIRNRLLSAPDRQSFIAAVADAARQYGLDISAQEVDAALAEARRQRLARWV